MGDLIDRDKLLDSLPKNDTVLSLDVRKIVADAPAVEVAPVVHGRWIEDERTYPGAGLANNICSVCGKIAFSSKQGLSINRKYKFCPNCGAKMRCDDEQE